MFGARSTCRAFPAYVVPCMSLDDSPVHDARNSRDAGGLLLVCKSTSYNLEVGRQGPTWRKGSKGGVSGPGTARSGDLGAKGNARARMLPENLEHLRMGWISWGSYETAWVTPGHDCLCPYQYGHGAAVSPQINDAIWNRVIGFEV